MRTAILAVITAFSLTSCGTTADPEEVDEIAAILRSSDSPLAIPLNEKQANCLAQAYLESGLSDDAIDRLKDGQPLAPVTDHDTKAITTITKKAADCM